jgi:WD40 repeat protein
MGFEAEIIIWDFATRTEVRRFKLHRVKVQALAFSPSGRFLVSLGGEDDGKVSFWDVETGKALCSATTGNGRGGFAECVTFGNNSETMFLTGGYETLRVWSFDEAKGKIAAETVTVRGLRRVVHCMVVDDADEYAYCGTTTGDVIQIGLRHAVLKAKGGTFEKGVTDLALTGTGDQLLVGTGTGKICLLNTKTWKTTKKSSVCDGAVTSVSLRGEGHEFFVGTKSSNIYRFNMATFESTVRAVAHSHAVNDVQFPEASELFGTCAGDQIRVWHTATNKELLRITIPNKVCNTFVFLKSGDAIVSGWNDGALRCHTPETGRLAFEIPNGNGKGVTAMAVTNNNAQLLSGGGDGQVRLWKFGSSVELVQTLKEHTGAITSIMVNTTDEECVTSSVDGTCIVWDLLKFTRKQILFANTLFKQVRYTPDEAQVLTVGSDRKVGYWEVFDGMLIREMELSLSGPVNSVDITTDGEHYVVGDAISSSISFLGAQFPSVILCSCDTKCHSCAVALRGGLQLHPCCDCCPKTWKLIYLDNLDNLDNREPTRLAALTSSSRCTRTKRACGHMSEWATLAPSRE